MILARFSHYIFSLLIWPAKCVVITTSKDEELACSDAVLTSCGWILVLSQSPLPPDGVPWELDIALRFTLG